MATANPSVPRLRALALSFAAGALRLVDNFFRLFNLSPVGAMGMFGGARLRSWQAYLVPIGIMTASDIGLWVFHGFDPDYSLWHISRPFVYGSFLLYVLLGRCLTNTGSPIVIGAASLIGSTQFFLITNFQSWLELTGLYSRDFAGLIECYVAGLPFAVRTVAGDLLFTAMLFGLHAFLSSRQPEAVAVAVPSAQGAP